MKHRIRRNRKRAPARRRSTEYETVMLTLHAPKLAQLQREAATAALAPGLLTLPGQDVKPQNPLMRVNEYSNRHLTSLVRAYHAEKSGQKVVDDTPPPPEFTRASGVKNL